MCNQFLLCKENFVDSKNLHLSFAQMHVVHLRTIVFAWFLWYCVPTENVKQNIVDNKFAVQFAQDFQKQMRKSE
jgi:hypothetical protein